MLSDLNQQLEDKYAIFGGLDIQKAKGRNVINVDLKQEALYAAREMGMDPI